MEERRALRRRANDTEMERRIVALEGRMHQVEQGVTRLSVGVEINNKQTEEMYKAFSAAKGGFRALEWIAKGAKPVFIIAACITALIAGIKTGVWSWPG